MDSDEDVNDFYDGTNSKSDDSDGAYVFVADDDFDDGIAVTSTRQEQSYKILTEADIAGLQEDDVLKLSNLLFISSVESIILLCNYSWDSGKLQDEWFADEDRVRGTVGLLKFPAAEAEKPNKRGRSRITCNICFERHPHCETSAASCGHRFCDECWRRYVSISASDGPSCLTLRCPEPSCTAAVGQDMVDRLAAEEDKGKYRRFLLRSYVEGSRSMKWCPAPGCEFAVEFEVGSASYDVCCGCSYQFCWNCTEEAHRPVDCETVAKWVFKNKDEAENTNWILANSKPCPKCRRPIEKNHGCMHMTCRPPCNFQFCWICLCDWKKHDVRSGGSISCNGFEKVKKVGEEDEFERRRKMAKMSIERYTHYYERWAANHSSRQKALADLQSVQSEKLEKLRNSQSETESQVKFVTEAWEQIVECRRVLKWTYAYGYYLPEDENAKKQFFEYLQGEAEAGLERLHQCAERELQVFLDAKDPCQDFSNFRTKLVDLTCVTRTYFENLVRALEKGLEDVDCSYRGSSKDCGPSQEDCGTSRKPSKKGSRRRSRRAVDVEIWSCNHCTYNNYGDTSRCAVCEQTR